LDDVFIKERLKEDVMYAIVQVGSQQYKVAEGDIVSVQKLDVEGPSLRLEKVLLLEDGDKVKIGQPFLTDVKVTAEIVEQEKDDKVVSFKYSKRKNTSWKKGHRQKLTTLKISKIDA
jgi:large subunit ribosomal protein L21